MKKIVWCWAVLLAALLSGCVNTGELVLEEPINAITFSIEKFLDDDMSTKTNMAADGTFLWSAGDTVGIYPNTGAQVYFEVSEGEGASSAVFDGGGWEFKASSTYYSYFPFIGDIYLDRNRIPVSFVGQKQIGMSNTNGIGSFDYMYTPEVSSELGDLQFEYKHLCCLLRFNLTLPAGKYTRLTVTAPEDLFVETGYFDLMAEKPAIVPTKYTNQLIIDLEDLVSVGDPFKVYIMVAPVNIVGKEWTVSVLGNQYEYQCAKSTAKEFEASTIYGFSCSSWTKVPYTEDPHNENLFLGMYYGEANCKIAYNVSNTTIDVTPYLTGEHFARTNKKVNPDITLAPAKAFLIWRENSLSLDVAEEVSNNVIEVSNIQGTGNAVIGVYNICRQLLWSYHLWVPGFDPEADYIVINGQNMMRAALGATSAWPNSAPSSLDYSASGLFYQWGRKDPLGRLSAVKTLTDMSAGDALGAKSPISNTGYVNASDAIETIVTDERTGIVSNFSKIIKYSFLNPADWIISMNSTISTYGEDCCSLWGNDGVSDYGKSIFDPSPKGWRVPDLSLYGTEPISKRTIDRVGYYPISDPTDIWLGFGERTNVSGFTTTSGQAFFWTRVPVPDSEYDSYYLSGSIMGVGGSKSSANSDRDRAKLIRCVAE